MANKAKKRKPGRKLPPLSRADLLPLAAAQARDQSLRAHMALVMVRSGHGDLSVLGELLRTVFVTYFACKSSGEVSYFEHFVEAESALKAGMDRGEAEGLWAVSNAGASALEIVLTLQDHHLVNRPSYLLERAQEQLSVILDKGVFPDLARDYKIANRSVTEMSDIREADEKEAVCI